MIKFGREICNDFSAAARMEWLVTNGLGSYASGTIAGVQTRRYHGLLIAALNPPLARTLLLEKFDETARYDSKDYALFANQWASGEVEPHGYDLLDSFYLDGTTPVWIFSFADALLEKRLWMQPGHNTTYIQYTLIRATSSLELTLKAIVNYRDHHHTTENIFPMRVESRPRGVQLTPPNNGTPFVILSDRGTVTPSHDWYAGYHMAVEAYRGLPDTENHLHAATFSATLSTGQSLTLIASTEPNPSLDVKAAWVERQQYERALLVRAWGDASVPMEVPAYPRRGPICR